MKVIRSIRTFSYLSCLATVSVEESPDVPPAQSIPEITIEDEVPPGIAHCSVDVVTGSCFSVFC